MKTNLGEDLALLLVALLASGQDGVRAQQLAHGRWPGGLHQLVLGLFTAAIRNGQQAGLHPPCSRQCGLRPNLLSLQSCLTARLATRERRLQAAETGGLC